MLMRTNADVNVKKLIDKGICDKGLILNPTNCECECDKSCDAREYLGYNNCKCRKKLVDKLVEDCSENIDGNEVIYNQTVNVSSSNYKCGSCTLYIVFFAVFSETSVIISAVFIYFSWYLKESNDQLCFKKIMFVLNLIHVFKQQFNECKSVKHIDENS